MTKLAVIAAVLTLAGAPVALAQSQGQLETQKGPTQRAAPQDTTTFNTERSYGAGEKGAGEMQGQPPGNRLARPADPAKTTRGDAMQPKTTRGDDTATSAKPGETLTDTGRTRPQTAERGPSAGQNTLDRDHHVDPGGRTPAKRADDGANNPPSDPNK